MNALIQGKSGTTPVMSPNAFSTNQRTNEDDSQSDFILKQASSATRRHETLAKKIAVTNTDNNTQ